MPLRDTETHTMVRVTHVTRQRINTMRDERDDTLRVGGVGKGGWRNWNGETGNERPLHTF